MCVDWPGDECVPWTHPCCEFNGDRCVCMYVYIFTNLVLYKLGVCGNMKVGGVRGNMRVT